MIEKMEAKLSQVIFIMIPFTFIFLVGHLVAP